MSTLADALLAELDDAALDALAERVADILAERQRSSTSSGLVDAQAVADALGVSRDYVYTHAVQLGGQKVGNGTRPRWRFDLDRTLAAWSNRLVVGESLEVVEPVQTRVSRCRRRAGKGSSARLLPIRGEGDA